MIYTLDLLLVVMDAYQVIRFSYLTVSSPAVRGVVLAYLRLWRPCARALEITRGLPAPHHYSHLLGSTYILLFSASSCAWLVRITFVLCPVCP